MARTSSAPGAASENAAPDEQLCAGLLRKGVFQANRLQGEGIKMRRLIEAFKPRCGAAMAPGAYEVPFVARKTASLNRYDGVVALGCVIRGATPHFDFVAREAAAGIARAAAETGTPISFGVLTVDTIEQAIERAGTKAGNKGAEAALACLETINLCKSIEEA